ncbi:hypothetical protein FQR65_LT13655 [Abscondita terminalis]|nr:hypothetical protein FQR65_LT13655 [Abscondita terminalis]
MVAYSFMSDEVSNTSERSERVLESSNQDSSNAPGLSYEVLDKLITEKLEIFKEDIIKSFSQKIIDIENRLTKLEAQHASFSQTYENNSSMMRNDEFTNVEEIISEMEDRRKRKCNVIVYNVPESTSPSVDDKIKDDLNIITDTLRSMNVSVVPHKVLRLGKKN